MQPYDMAAMSRLERGFAWVGGGLFVAALALCTSWYLFVLGRPRLSRGWAPVVADTILITIFALHHSVFAREGVKQAMASMSPDRLLRSVYVWIASLLLILVCFSWQPIGGDLYQATQWRAVAHGVIQLAGIALIAQSVRTIDPLELAGIRSSSGSGGLQTVGPYRLVRHPLYLGWMLAAFGAAHMTGDRFAFAALTSLYLVIAVPWEERSLMAAFGDEYARYRRLVRWRIIPFVY
jgi:protein-S-isoprenylcysteine O-methyltransferase Ste14